MSAHFWSRFIAAFVLVLGALGACAWATVSWMTDPPLETYSTSVFEFQVPRGWHCDREDTEYICSAAAKNNPAIIIIAMKYRSATDTLQAYEQHLGKPVPVALHGGKMTRPELRYLRRSWIGGHEWVDSLQFGSELQGFYTDYLAATTSHVAILVTFSVKKDFYALYLPQMKAVVLSLKIYQS